MEAVNTTPVRPSPEPTLSQALQALPAWVTIAAGGVVAAIVGAMLGGALHI